MSALPPVVDLCAATGLLARAFRDEGFPIAAGYEILPERAAAWSANLGAPCHVRDVTTLRARELREHADRHGRVVIIGGFPCEDYSQANLRKTKDTSLRDAGLELVRQVAPTACAIENVRAGWEGVRGVSYARDCEQGGFTMRERGFYGAPFIRPTHGDEKTRPLSWFEFPEDSAPLQPYAGWGGAIPGFTFMADFTQADDWEKRNVVYVKHASEPAWTVHTKPGWAVWTQGAPKKSFRWLTWEDHAALNGFPTDWIWPARMGDRLHSIGDAVPLALGRAVARAVRRQIEQKEASTLAI